MSEDILVLIDWENLNLHCKNQRNEKVDLEALLNHAKTLGRVRHVLAFVGFMERSGDLVRILHRNGIEPRFTMTKQDLESKAIKNAADIQSFLIVSGDQGFLPLLRELKMYGRSVNILSMAEKNTIRQLAKEADSIAYYDDLVKPRGEE